MKQKKERPIIIGGFVLGAMILVWGMAIFGLSKTVNNINDLAVSETPEAVLASAGVEERGEVVVPVMYFDQKADECVNMYESDLREELLVRQFEWTGCGYEKMAVEKGLVDYYLDDEGALVGVSGQLVPNRGLNNLNQRWFNEVEDKSKKYTGTLALKYVAQELKFSYENDSFYPLDDVTFSDGDSVNDDGHNHLFTMSLAVPFKARKDGNEALKITADDDTFVFVDNKLVIDLGGIHEPTVGELRINEQGEVYASEMGQEMVFTGATIDSDNGAIIRIFHADRDSASSVFEMELYSIEPKVINTQIADSDGVQVAYDPNDPLHASPLGVSTSSRFDNKKSYMVIATIYGAVIVVVAVGVMALVRYLLRAKR